MAERTGYAQVRREHEELVRGFKVLSDLLESEPAAGEAAPWAARLRGELQGLATQLKSHFEHEETGFFRTIGREHPGQSGTIQTLRGEHGDFVRYLEGLLVHSLGTSGPVSYDEVKAELQGWLGRLREHERRETSLLVDSVMQELGIGDDGRGE